MERNLTTRELLFIQDTCLDAEMRCARRAAEARMRGDHAACAYELQAKGHYSALKRNLLRTIRDGITNAGLDRVESSATKAE